MAEDTGTPARGNSSNNASDHWIVALVKLLLGSLFGRLLIVVIVVYYIFATLGQAFLPFKVSWYGGWFPVMTYSADSSAPISHQTVAPAEAAPPNPCSGPKEDQPIVCR
ncbi:hypothetical protein [Paraburkholderia aromaticivorans]|uniref:hypothetical protein n=1 Tax=Paraburkholderia aromaticivorans TaxID=2026199 RepID=UPI00145604E7|nr:hypothetical protein [Paraburkholderia aromaticivorans]